jgi:oxygen-independent coproporphyrinogen-3 oxidase
MRRKHSLRQPDALRAEFSRQLHDEEDPTYLYTYPFKGAYRPITGWKSVIQSWNQQSGPLNLYIHIPYCEMKCSFCNLFTVIENHADTLERYTNTLLKEIRLISDLVSWEHFMVQSLYFGGGSPTLLSTKQLERIIQELRDHFCFDSGAELAIESAPNSIDEQKLRELRQIGFQRLSFGIQSFDDRELNAMNRHYDSDLGRRITSLALEAGFMNVNIDLIYGLPNQMLHKWLDSLKIGIDLGVQTISLYPLTLRSYTHFGRRYEVAPQEFQRKGGLYHLYDTGVNVLTSHGYRQSTMALFAKQNGGCSHESNEFKGVPTLGLGAAALTYSPAIHYTSGYYFERTSNAKVLTEYFDAINKHELPIRSGIALNEEEVQRRYVILGLLYLGFDQDEYCARFKESLETRFGLEMDILRAEGCIDECGTHLAPSQRGRRFSNLVANLFASDKVKQLSAGYR